MNADGGGMGGMVSHFHQMFIVQKVSMGKDHIYDYWEFPLFEEQFGSIHLNVYHLKEEGVVDVQDW